MKFLQLTSLITAFALVVHLLAGCCFHHAHAQPPEVAADPAPAAGNCSCTHDDHGPAEGAASDDEEGPGGSSGRQHDHEGPCDEVRCDLVSTNPGAPAAPSPLCDGLITRIELPDLCLAFASAARCSDSGEALHPPAPLYDLYETLLI